MSNSKFMIKYCMNFIVNGVYFRFKNYVILCINIQASSGLVSSTSALSSCESITGAEGGGGGG